MHYCRQNNSADILRREWQRALSARAAAPDNRRPIGIYIGSANAASRRRAIAIARQAPDYFTLLGSGLRGKSEALAIIDLPAMPAPRAENHCRAALRLRRLGEWLNMAKPALLLVDSCPEAAALARAQNIPAAYMRLSGARSDAAHLRAFAAAEAVLCPFHALLEADATPQWLRRRSRYFPGLGESAAPANAAAKTAGEKPRLLLAAGCGGDENGGGGREPHIAVRISQMTQMAAALPGWEIDIIAGSAAAGAAGQIPPANLHFYGPAANISAFIGAADLIIGAADDNLISAAAAAAKPFICLSAPDKSGRQSDDGQYAKAARLAALKAAVICRHWPRDWAKTVARAMQRGAVLQALHEDNAAARAADFLLNLAYGVKQPAAAPGSRRRPAVLIGADSAGID